MGSSTTSVAELFKGMKRFECRVAIEKKLEELGLYRGKAPNPMRLGLCSRSKDVIEPMLKPQWWVNCADMAKDACGGGSEMDAWRLFERARSYVVSVVGKHSRLVHFQTVVVGPQNPSVLRQL